MGLFSRIKQGLSRTRGNVSAQMDELIENTKEIDDEFFEEITDILVMADAGAKTAMEEVEKLKALCAERQIKDPAKAKDALKEVLSSSMKAAPMNLKETRMNKDEYGGAPLLGVNGLAVKAHGSSNAYAFGKALEQARKMVRGDLTDQLRLGLEKLSQE